MLVSQSCLTLCDPMDYSPPGSSVHGILQTRILKWVVIPFSRGSSQPRDQTQVSRIAGRFFTFEPPGKPLNTYYYYFALAKCLCMKTYSYNLHRGVKNW